MGVVASLHGSKPNKLTIAANRADAPWFASNPERQHFMRRATPVEHMQAMCLHGCPAPGQQWCVAARRLSGGLIERRFYTQQFARVDGGPLDYSDQLGEAKAEAFAQEQFAQATIAGERSERYR